MSVKYFDKKAEITYKDYILVVFANGVIFEAIHVNKGYRVTLTEKEREFFDVLFKLFIYDHKKYLTNNRK